MSKTFTTICPHCREEIQVAYKDAMTEMARTSAQHRKGNSERMREIINKRWDDYRKKKRKKSIDPIST